MRAREAEAEGRLRALHARLLEFRSKARPVEEYAASDKAEQLQRARQALDAARARMQQYDAQAQVLLLRFPPVWKAYESHSIQALTLLMGCTWC